MSTFFDFISTFTFVVDIIAGVNLLTSAIGDDVFEDDLLVEFSTTHAQIDQYSQIRTVEITEEVQKSVLIVLQNTRHQQEELLADANH